MTPLKDAVEVASPIAESTTAHVSERPKADSGQLRSDAVSLDVPVKVHGSRVTEIVRGITPHTEPFEEQTSTMIVFPQGGVVRMSTAVSAGQMVVLTNLKSGHDAICRIVKVRAYAQSQSYVELEFTNRQSGYWGVHFATDELEPAKTILPPPPVPSVMPIAPEPVTEKSESKPAAQISWAPAASLQPPVERAAQLSKLESSFAPIGSKEDVQPAASATLSKTQPQRPLAPAAPLSMTELRGDAHVASPVHASLGAGVPGEMTDLSDDLADAVQQEPPVAFAKPAASASLSSAPSAAPKAFGARFDSSVLGAAERGPEAHEKSGQNWFLIAAGVAGLLVVGAGAAFYLHMLPGGKAAPSSASLSAPAAPAGSLAISPVSPVQSNAAQPAASSPVPQTAQSNTSAASSAPPVAARAVEATPPPARVQPSAPAIQKTPSRVPDMSATLTSHPVSAARSASGDAEPAPSVDGGAASPSGDLEGISTASEITPPPPGAPAPVVKPGGDVKPPKPISSLPPVYPPTARTMGVEGNVVVSASIGPTGAVVAAKVISGPAMLRQAALDAVRRWKYQPATLNGQAVPVDISVTVQFHR
jgi:periplasmic protein TonB